MYYIGIDVSKNQFTTCIINQKAQIISRRTFPYSLEGFQDFLSVLQTLNPVTIIMESSNRYHIPLASFLISENFQPFIVNPKFIYQFAKYHQATSPSKTDPKDAFLLALFALKNPELLKPSPIPDDAKIIARTLQKLTKELAKTKTQIKACLSVLFPELEKNVEIFSKTILTMLFYLPSAKDIAKAPLKRIHHFLLETSEKGRKPSITPETLKTLAKNSIGTPHKGYETTLKVHIKKYFFLQEEIAELEALLDETLKNWSPKERELISSIKGISKNLANRFLTEIGDIKKFSKASKLIKYAGLDPVIKQSGKWESRKGISKRGSPYLRDIIYQMAYGVKNWNKVFWEYWRRKKEAFGSSRKTMIALANKLIRVIFTMLRKGKTFKPELVAPSTRGIKHISVEGVCHV